MDHVDPHQKLGGEYVISSRKVFWNLIERGSLFDWGMENSGLVESYMTASSCIVHHEECFPFHFCLDT